MALAPGNRLGPYEVTGLLGQGGMGEVYRARDTRLDRTVALKVLAPDHHADDDARRRFHTEALALARLAHRHVAYLHDVLEHEGAEVLVMELVEGEALDAAVARGPLAETEVLRLGIELADGLAAAHAVGVLHRDLKPSNLRTMADGTLKILDFGLARLRRTSDDTTVWLSATGVISGTLPYMAPEQLLAGVLDERTDLWAVGVVLYELATGARPFADPVRTRLADRILHEDPEPPSARCRALSSALERVILRCLRKRPEERYPSAAALRADLQAIRDGVPEGVSATPDRAQMVRTAGLPRRSRGVRAALRRPWGRAVAALGLLALVLGTGYAAARRWWPRPAPITSLAVLPLENAPDVPEHYADGITDELITSISGMAQLEKVINRRSVMAYKGTNRRISDIGKELGVDALLTGTCYMSGKRMRVTAQLVSARDDRVLWAGSFDRPLEDAMALQQQLAREMIAQVGMRFLPTAAGRVQRVDPDAYDRYLQAVTVFNALDQSTVARADTLLQEATTRDPAFARAYALRAVVLVYAMLFGLADVTAQGQPIRAVADRALLLDDSVAEAHAAHAQVLLLFDWNWDAADAEHRRAIELAPNVSLVHTLYANHLGQRGRHSESINQAMRAVALDPLSDIAAATLFWANFRAGRFQECADRGTGLKYDVGQSLADYCGARLGRRPATCTERPEQLSCAIASLVSGDTVAARRVFAARCAAVQDPGHVAPGTDAWCLQLAAALGRKEPMLRWVESLVEQRHWFATFLRGPDYYDLLKDEPRFHAALETIGLPR